MISSFFMKNSCLHNQSQEYEDHALQNSSRVIAQTPLTAPAEGVFFHYMAYPLFATDFSTSYFYSGMSICCHGMYIL